jgi:hypothetical protein
MNAMICLSRKSQRTSSPLFDLGYQLEYIGPRFANRQGQIINPDLSFKGDAHHTILLTDCKTGGLDHEQATKYSRLSPEDIISANITTLDSAGLVLDIVFVGGKKSEQKLLEAELRNSYGIPIVILRDGSLKKKGQNHFRNSTLDSLFANGVIFSTKIPTGYYPFSSDDPPSYMLASIAPIMLDMLMRNVEFSEDDIIQKAHPLYDYLDKNEKVALKAKIGRLLTSIGEDTEFRFTIDKQKKWKIDPDMSLTRFKKMIQALIEKMEPSEKLRDTTLLQWAQTSQA